jgi:hypothetical protein
MVLAHYTLINGAKTSIKIVILARYKLQSEAKIRTNVAL